LPPSHMQQPKSSGKILSFRGREAARGKSHPQHPNALDRGARHS
jgi:hypothetical protein